MQNFLGNVGGLLNRLTGGANQLGLGALMYGSSQAQQGLKNMFGMPTTGDYIRQWEAQRTTPMQRAKVGQPMVLGGKLGYKAADGSWQPRGDMESENIPQYLPGSPQADKSGYVWDAARQQASGNRPPVATPPAVGPQLSPEERAYNAERSRIAQLTEQNPEFQNIGQLRNDLRDQGMAIWAAKYGNLAKQVKPGQSGYEAIQRTLYPGGTPASALPAESEAMLNAIAPTNEFGVRPDVTPMPGQLPSFGSNTEAMFNAITGGGSLVTPMPQQSVATTPQDQAQGLAETYKKALLGGLGNDPLGIAGIYQYGR